MPQINDRAIVIKIMNYDEFDLIVTFLTEKNGKISCIAKGCKRTKSKLQPYLSLLKSLDINYIEKKNLSILKEAKLNMYLSEEKNKKLFYLIHYICEFLSKNSYEGIGQAETYITLTKFLTFVQKTNFEANFYYLIFNLQMMKEFGYTLEMNKCTACEKDLTEEQTYQIDPGVNGILCNNCSGNKTMKISLNEFKLIKLIQTGNFSILSKIEPTISEIDTLTTISERSIQNHLDVVLKSQQFMIKH